MEASSPTRTALRLIEAHGDAQAEEMAMQQVMAQDAAGDHRAEMVWMDVLNAIWLFQRTTRWPEETQH